MKHLRQIKHQVDRLLHLNIEPSIVVMSNEFRQQLHIEVYSFYQKDSDLNSIQIGPFKLKILVDIWNDGIVRIYGNDKLRADDLSQN